MSTINEALAAQLRVRRERLEKLEQAARSLSVGAEEQELFNMAINVFGSEQEAAQWLLDEPLIMDGLTPLELLFDPVGRERIRHSLNCLLYGMPA